MVIIALRVLLCCVCGIACGATQQQEHVPTEHDVAVGATLLELVQELTQLCEQNEQPELVVACNTIEHQVVAVLNTPRDRFLELSQVVMCIGKVMRALHMKRIHECIVIKELV